MDMIGKENDFAKYKYIIIAVVLAVVVIFLSQVILENQRSKDYNEFIKKCDFDKIDAIWIKGKDIKTTITNKRIIYDLWQLVKNAKAPGHRQKKLYDYSLDLYFYIGNDNPVMIYLDKDKGSDEIQIAFYGSRSTFTMEGIDENKLVEKIIHLIIVANQ